MFSFAQNPDGHGSSGKLVQLNNGKFYGVTSSGGKNSQGILFEWDADSNLFVKKFDFSDSALFGYSGLILANNGKLYGVANSYSGKAIYEWDPFMGKFSIIRYVQSQNAINIILTSSGNLSGIAASQSGGIIFEINPETYSYEEKIEFREGQSFTLFVEAGNHKYYLVSEGSNPGLFEWDSYNNQLIKKLNCEYYMTSLYKCINGRIYGTGLSPLNDAFLEYDSINNSFVKKFEFDSIEKGAFPDGSLCESDGIIYGITREGGKYYEEGSRGGYWGGGVLYGWDILKNVYTKKLDFSGEENGFWPFGNLIKGKNGKIYGMTEQGGPGNKGFLYEWDPVTGIFIKKISFSHSNMDSESGFTELNKGNLIGTLKYGGRYNNGTLFQIDAVTKSYKTVYDFKADSMGIYPSGKLFKASNGKYYGLTSCGGKYHNGVLFEWDINSESYIKKADFTAEIGSHPIGSLVEGENGRLYGLAYQGGEERNYKLRFGTGTIFEWNPDSEALIKKYDFKNTPPSSLIMAENEKLYGLQGNFLFEWDLMNEVYTTKHFYEGIKIESLIKAGNGNLYGLTRFDNNGYGALLEFNSEKDSFTTKMHFDGIENGKYPSGYLVQGTNGKLYGTTESGGKYDKGVLFEWDLLTGGFKKLIDFDGTENGANPFGSLFEISNAVTDTIYRESCNDYTTPSGNYTFTRSGIYKDFLTTRTGRDSVISIILKIRNTRKSININSCCRVISPSGKYTWQNSGVYLDTIPGSWNCDSIITVNLVIEAKRSTSNATVCNSYISPSGLYTWMESGIYTDTISNLSGCDSIITINLTVTHIDTTLIETDSGLMAVQENANYQWLKCNNHSLVEGQVSRSLNIGEPGNYAVVITDNGCMDTSACYTILPTGIKDDPFNKSELYPNPTSGSFTINLGEVMKEVKITITAPDGRKVYEENFRKIKTIILDPEIPQGSYVVNVFSGNHSRAFKLIKNNPNITRK